MSQNHNFSLECVWESSDPMMSSALVSLCMTFSSIYMCVMGDYTLLLYSHYAALWASEQHNGSYVLPGTSWYTEVHTQIHSDTVTDYHTTFLRLFSLLPWYVFCSIPDMNPSSSCLPQAKTHPLVQPCTILQQPLPHFFPLPCLKSQCRRPAAHQPDPVSVLKFSSPCSWLGLCPSSPASSLAPDLQALVRLTMSLSTLHPLCPPAPAPRLSSVYSQP